MGRKILVIEDDRDMAGLLEIHLQDLGCHVQRAHDGSRGLELALAEPWDMVILDIMLPGMDGLEICRRLREQPDYVRILMLTAKSSELDRILGLETGADDYLTKPFSMRELQARVKAQFRRMDALESADDAQAQEPIRVGELVIDRTGRTVALRGRPVQLTTKEFDLLVQFARNPGRVYSRSELLDLVWHYQYQGYEHTVNSHINRLRSKIEQDPAKPDYILTVWGVGYKFAGPAGSSNGDSDV